MKGGCLLVVLFSVGVGFVSGYEHISPGEPIALPVQPGLMLFSAGEAGMSYSPRGLCRT